MLGATPQIVYGATPTTILFPYPPSSKMNDPEEYDVQDHTTISLSGVRQTSVDYIQAIRKLTFSFVNTALLTELQAFLVNWAYLGQPFQYYDDHTTMTFVTYDLLSPIKFQPKRIMAVGNGDYIHDVAFTFRRSIGAGGTTVMQITIANNQSVAANLTGIVLDPTVSQTVRIFYELVRSTSSTELVANGEAVAVYHASTSTWAITPTGDTDGDNTGVTFLMSGNQVQYLSSNLSGTNYVGTIKIQNLILS